LKRNSVQRRECEIIIYINTDVRGLIWGVQLGLYTFQKWLGLLEEKCLVKTCSLGVFRSGTVEVTIE
jgi:hypothetical protein